MKRKLQTEAGKAVYAARKCVAEPVSGQIKQVRGFRQFLLRAKEKVKEEWALVCLTHNILRVTPQYNPAERNRRVFFAKNGSRRVPIPILPCSQPAAGVLRSIRATQKFGSQLHRAPFLGQAPSAAIASQIELAYPDEAL